MNLYVKEAWRIGAWDENWDRIACDYKADAYCDRSWRDVPDEEMFQRFWIDSTNEAMAAGRVHDEEGQYQWEPGDSPTRWRSSRFMPKLAARLWLDVLSVRVERVKDISAADAGAEGIEVPIDGLPERGWREIWIELWDGINAKRGFSFAANPYVWVVEFKRLEATT